MQRLTAAQIIALTTNNLAEFSEANRYDCDEHGNSILHCLVINAAPLAAIQHAVTALHVSPHTFNQQFKSPIDIAIENNNWPVARYLLEQPLEVDNEWLNLILGSLFEGYAKDDHQLRDNDAVAGFFASRLSGVNVQALLNQNNKAMENKYLGHLRWLKGESAYGTSLTGFLPDRFLPLRQQFPL